MKSLKGFLTSARDVRTATSPLRLTSNKYTRGRVLILAGSEEWRGAMEMAAYAAHNAIAALRTVSGFVTVAAPAHVLNLAGAVSPVFVLKKVHGGPEEEIVQLEKVRHDAILIGPGLEKRHLPVAFFKRLLKIERKKKNRIVVDAAALHVFSKMNIAGKELILTPHDGEFRNMTGIDLKGKPLQGRISEAKRFAAAHDCTIVLKGHATVITDGKRVKVNIADTPSLATMGTGDVLAGMIAAYASQHKDPFESAVAAVYVHSKIGDALYKRKGEHITAQDIIDAIPKMLKRFDVIKEGKTNKRR